MLMEWLNAWAAMALEAILDVPGWCSIYYILLEFNMLSMHIQSCSLFQTNLLSYLS